MRAEQIIAPCSPCRNWENCQLARCLLSSSLSLSPSLFHVGEPKMPQASCGMPSESYGSTSSDQSIRLVESHCLSLPFWYSDSSRSRPSSYSQVKRVSRAIVDLQPESAGTAYRSWVVMGAPWVASGAQAGAGHGP